MRTQIAALASRAWELTLRLWRWLAAKPPKELALIAVYFTAGSALGGAVLLFLLVQFYKLSLPDVLTMKNYAPSLVTTIYDRHDRPAAEFYVEKRMLKPYKEIPELMKKATIAIEDDRFFLHKGVDFIGILRAALVNLREGGVVQGGSTITQQVAKVMFLSRERTFARKIKEFLLSQRIEENFSKEEILEIYLNQIYYGHGNYGVEAAAHLYFDKSVNELTLGEMATLAGLPKAPNGYSPFNNPKGAVNRRNLVIGRMRDTGYITPEQAQKALDEPLRLAKQKRTPNDIPYFAEHVRRYIYGKYGSGKVYHEGMKVYTTLDAAWQKQAQAALIAGIEENDRRIGYRGPLGWMDLNTERPDWDDLNPPRRNMAEAEYFAPGKRFKAVVRMVTPDNIVVELNGHRGIISKAGFGWAHKYDLKTDGRSFEPVKDATKLVRPGNIVEIKVQEKFAGDPMHLDLDQAPTLQGGIVSLDYTSGEIRAMVGGYDFEKSPFNRAVQATRQPGSAFKPLIYAAAMDRGFTPATVVIDSPMTFESSEKDWKPGNFKNEFYGPTTIRTAVIESRNIVTIKVLQKIGLQYAIEYAQKLGIHSHLENNLSIALGSSGLTLMELTSAFGVIANGGVRNEPYFIRRVEDLSGNVIEKTEPVSAPVMPEDTAFLMSNVMQGVVEEGTGSAVRALGVPTAGKTGTTNDYMDAWFLGYTSGVVSGVWVGRDQEEPIGRNETGGRAAAPIWLDYMRGVIRDLPVRPFVPPKNIKFVRVNKITGGLTTPDDPDSIFEAFKEGTEPDEVTQQVVPAKAALPAPPTEAPQALPVKPVSAPATPPPPPTVN